MIPGEFVLDDASVLCNQGRVALEILVVNRGDRPVQVGSHYHFFEVNDSLEFDRRVTRGMRLDIPAGAAVRFEPGEPKSINLISFGGTRTIYGFRNKVDGVL